MANQSNQSNQGQGQGQGNQSKNNNPEGENQYTKGSRSQSGDNTSQRGFASMDEDKQREIASKCGKASHGGGGSSQSQQQDE